jgi:hypothetical protein
VPVPPAAAAPALTPAPVVQPVPLAPHRAIYDLTLDDRRPSNQVTAVRGRIAFEFGGSACDGYTLNFRQLTELATGGGERVLQSDLRSATYESGDGTSFRFTSQQFTNRQLTEDVDGRVERAPDRSLTVRVAKPREKTAALEANVVFPTEHMRRIIAAAVAGQPLLEIPVFDGSQDGEKVYNTLSVIGRRIVPGDRPPTDVARERTELQGLARWPVTISYFERTGAQGEQTPVYSLSFELYENGVSRALVIDYGEFVLKGELSALDMLPPANCR